ncbi:MAG: hypothetical protein QME85_07690 [Candidatus Saccharicenans sp.]|nr:hypothetical protein [Candidatus Saccharicenans sp.]
MIRIKRPLIINEIKQKLLDFEEVLIGRGDENAQMAQEALGEDKP